MKTTNLTDVLSQLQSSPIWIAGTTPKHKGRKDIRELLAKSATEGDSKIFILDDTFRDLRDLHNFIIEEGCEIRDRTGCYECIKVAEYKPKLKKYPMLITRRIV